MLDTNLVDRTSVDRSIYHDDELYQLELERLFCGGWVLVGVTAEIPHRGDFVRSAIGETPVLVTRAKDGNVRVLVNSCSHRGALVAYQHGGNCNTFTCLYHQWTYDNEGRLLGVPMQAQYEDLEKGELGLQNARVAVVAGLIFAALCSDPPPIEDYLGASLPHIEAMMYGGRIELLGYHRYEISANWKLFWENSLDCYHQTQLHTFVDGLAVLPTGDNICFENGHGVIMWPMANPSTEAMRRHIAENATFKMRDFALFQSVDRPEGSVNRVLGIFPNAVLLEQWDTLSVRQLLPRGPGSVEIHTLALGVAGESKEKQQRRARLYGNYFGPAGYAGRDDVVAAEAVQATHAQPEGSRSLMRLGDVGESRGNLRGEYTIRGFYEAYRARMSGDNGEPGEDGPATLEAAKP
ncbi:MAG: aromatic ring-hydroxylating oxygenase subunit alpha [Actinomycetota bacterium]